MSSCVFIKALVLGLFSVPSLCVTTILQTGTAPVVATPSGTPNATGAATVSAIPLYESGIANYTSPWTLSLTVFEEQSDVLTALSLSWPNPQSDLPYGDVCLIWMPNVVGSTFTGIDSSAEGSGNCSALIGSQCALDLGDAALRRRDICSVGGTWVGWPIPDSCASTNDDPHRIPTAFGLFNPRNDTAQISHIDPANSANVSTVFSIAMNRIYPVFILEEHTTGNVTSSTGNIGCVQALNLTVVEASGGGNIDSSTASTATVTGTASSTGAGTTTGTISQTGSTTPTGSSSAAKGFECTGLILKCAVVLGISTLY